MGTFQVSITDRCDKNCPYCISKMTYQVNHYRFNWDNLQDAVHFAKSKKIRIAKITGKWGEPLMVPERITGLLPHLHGFDTEIQTNAKKVFDERSRWNIWKNLGLSLVSISCVHWDREIHGDGSFTHSTYLDTVIHFLKQLRYKVRLNCLLIHDLIDSPDKIDKFINKFPTVDQISFIPIETSDKYLTATGLAAHRWACTHNINTKERQAIMNYLSSRYKKIRETDYSTTFECGIYFADCLKIPKEKNEHRHLIYFPDGTLRYSWEDPDSIVKIT